MAGIFSFNIGELARPATVLIEKISEVVGGIAKPYQIVRLAKADSKAAMIRAESDIEISDLRVRAANRFITEEMSKQNNMESITGKAIPHLKENATPESMENDWITNFFDKCRIVSDADMQELWARILAGEANAPGAFSRKTVNLMADLEKSDAEMFRNLCRFVWAGLDNRPTVPVIFDCNDEIYKQYGISFHVCTHLDTLGLIIFDNTYNFNNTLHTLPALPALGVEFHPAEERILCYHGKSVDFGAPNKHRTTIPIGAALFTQAGREIASICEVEPVDGFFEYAYDKWERRTHILIR